MAEPVTNGGRDDLILRRSALAGALAAALTWFPAAVGVGLAYRFPIPFAGFATSIADILWAALVYWVAGGFLVLAAAGAATGWWLARRRPAADGPPRWAVYGAGVALGVLAAMLAAAAGEVLGPR
jgi:hypothetical protein